MEKIDLELLLEVFERLEEEGNIQLCFIDMDDPNQDVCGWRGATAVQLRAFLSAFHAEIEWRKQNEKTELGSPSVRA